MLAIGSNDDYFYCPMWPGKIVGSDGKYRVVIMDGIKRIESLFSPYTGNGEDWAEYSPGVRLVQNKIWIKNKPRNLCKLLRSTDLHEVLSDEGVITKAYYPKR